jgi:prepilin-type N-terminal cleavage/methylation domain-containing protein
MINPSQLQRHFKGPTPSQGFTLIELLLSAALVSSAAVIGGMGLTSIITSSTAVNEESERHDELNRALDFITAEIRNATSVSADPPPPSAAFSTATPPATIKADTIQPILSLKTDAGNDIVYYVAELASSQDSLWRGPKVIYRWHEFTDDGLRITNEALKHHILIDSLDNEAQTQNAITCPSGLKGAALSKSTIQKLGFYACVDNANKMASLFQIGRVDKALEKTESMFKRTQAYSRATETLNRTPIIPGIPTPPSPGGREAGPPLVPTSGGYEVKWDLAEFELSHRGGAITCGVRGPTIPTVATVVFDRPDNTTTTLELNVGNVVVARDIPKGTKVSFTASRQPIGNCGAYTVNTNFHTNTQIIALGNGAAIPLYDPYEDQDKIGTFLANHIVEDKISIADNQQVFLFELGEPYSSNPGPAYDFQDLVLLADLTPRKRSINFAIESVTVDGETTTTTTAVN